MSTDSNRKRSKPSSAPATVPAQLEFLVDRSLSKAVARALREHGLTVHTLDDVYGSKAAEQVEDVDWLTLAGQRGWVVLHKDGKIRRRPVELLAIQQHGVRAFVLTNGNIVFDEQARWFARNRNRIIARCARPGPYIYGVYEERIERLWPRA